MNIYLEIFGYIGTALVIVSMTMSSLLKLRIFNICGSVISLIYAIICNTWPIALMNFCLIAINLYHTIRQLRQKHAFDHTTAQLRDATVQYFLSHNAADIEKAFPGYQTAAAEEQVHLLFAGSEIAGIFVGQQEENVLHLSLAYVLPRYRDSALGHFLFPLLQEQGAKRLIAPVASAEYTRYLMKLGFAPEDDQLKKEL